MVTAHRCGFCTAEFTSAEAQPACAHCPLSRGCTLVRCPHCGYENPLAPEWLAKLRGWLAVPAGSAPGERAR